MLDTRYNRGIEASDRRILRDLANRTLDAARHQSQTAKQDLWRRHNSLQRTRPLFLCLPEMSWSELIPESLVVCEHPLARTYEWGFRKSIYRFHHIHDDFVLGETVNVPLVYRSSGLGMNPEKVRIETAGRHGSYKPFAYNDDALALWSIYFEYRSSFYESHRTSYAQKPVLTDPDDLERLRAPVISVDEAQTERNREIMEDTLGDILPVRIAGRTFVNCSLIGTFNGLRGSADVMMDMYDRPEWLHRAMQCITDAMRSEMQQCEVNNWLDLNEFGGVFGSSLPYIDELPADDFDGKSVRLKDQWGMATIQSAPHVSPDMQEEFVMQYQRRLLECYGVNSFGCCEPLTAGNIEYVKLIPRLRKVIVSPWSDLDPVADALEDRYILAWKPNPVQISPLFDLERSRTELSEVLKKTCECITEIVLKDINAVSGEPQRVDRYTAMASELVGASAEERVQASPQIA